MSGCVVWITGLPASGKTTLALATANVLRARRANVVVLDGDALREALVPTPGYDAQGRDMFYATLARLAATLAKQDTIVLVPATAHLRQFRERARQLVGSFIEVFVDTPLDECSQRSEHYRSAAVERLPGIGVPYEPPEHPDLVVRPGDDATATLADLAISATTPTQQRADARPPP